MKTLMLLGMLLIPGLAWAGGWLVWVELTLSEKDHAPATTWSILAVKETEQACQAEVNQYVAQWKKPPERDDEVTVQGYTVTVRRASPLGGVKCIGTPVSRPAVTHGMPARDDATLSAYS